jgi:hypothetical protein
MNKPNSLSIDIVTEIPPVNAPGQAAAVCVFADEPRAPGDAARLGEELARACERALQDGEFEGEAETALMLRVQGANGGGGVRTAPVVIAAEHARAAGTGQATRPPLVSRVRATLGSHDARSARRCARDR